jgi:CRP-like cAMP-binding protein
MTIEPGYLKQYTCFRDLSSEQRKSVAQLATAECFFPGYTLFEKGQPGERLFALVKGEVEILQDLGGGAPPHVERILADELLGCATFVPPYVYASTARSLSEIEVLEIDAEALRQLMNADCALGFAIQQQVMKILLDRIKAYLRGK